MNDMNCRLPPPLRREPPPTRTSELCPLRCEQVKHVYVTKQMGKKVKVARVSKVGKFGLLGTILAASFEVIVYSPASGRRSPRIQMCGMRRECCGER